MKQTHLITAAALLALSPLVQAVDKHEPAFSRVIVDEFEARDADEGTVAAWEAAAWYGGDLNKLRYCWPTHFRSDACFARPVTTGG